MEDNKDKIQGQEDVIINEDRLVEKLIERMTNEGFCRIFNPSQDISTTETAPTYIKDMYKLPFEQDSIPRMTVEQREQLYKKPKGHFDEESIKELHKKEMEEFEKSDIQLLREFFKREWEAIKQLWREWGK